MGFSSNNLSDDSGESSAASDVEVAAFMGWFVSDRIHVGGTLFAQFADENNFGGLPIGETMIGIGPDIGLEGLSNYSFSAFAGVSFC